MASPCLIRLNQCAAADVPTPPAGKVAIFLDSATSQPSYKDSSAVVNVFGAGIPATLLDAKGDLIAASADNTAAKVTVGTNGKVLMADSAQTAGVKWENPTGGLTDDGNSGATLTVDFSTGKLVHKITLTANCTFTFTAPLTGSVIVLRISQDATGSRTVTWPATVHWPSGTAPTLTTTASKVDVFTFLYDGTTYFGVTSGLNYTA